MFWRLPFRREVVFNSKHHPYWQNPPIIKILPAIPHVTFLLKIISHPSKSFFFFTWYHMGGHCPVLAVVWRINTTHWGSGLNFQNSVWSIKSGADNVQNNLCSFCTIRSVWRDKILWLDWMKWREGATHTYCTHTILLLSRLHNRLCGWERLQHRSYYADQEKTETEKKSFLSIEIWIHLYIPGEKKNLQWRSALWNQGSADKYY